MVDGAAPRAKRYTVWDSKLPGFGVRISPSGTKTFVARYRAGGGRRGTLRQLVVGRYGVITADKAREKAEAVLAAVTLGEDPQETLTFKRAELTVSELCDLYLMEGCATKKPLTIYTDKGRIERHIKPLLGKRSVSQVTREHVETFMRAVAEGKTADNVKTKKRGRAIVKGGEGAATRAMGLLGAIFQFAVTRKMRLDNPVRGVRRYKEKKLERFLSPNELGRLGDALAAAETNGQNVSAVRVIRLLALTGCRRHEIAHLKWSEVDLERACLRLEDSKTGQKTVPIGAAAVLLLSETPRKDGALYVFPATRDPTKAFEGTPKAWQALREVAGLSNLRLHDLRHGFASVGLASGQTLSLIGKLLGHKDIGTTSRYAHLADDPVRAAADRIAGVVDGAMRRRDAEVITLSRLAES